MVYINRFLLFVVGAIVTAMIPLIVIANPVNITIMMFFVFVGCFILGPLTLLTALLADSNPLRMPLPNLWWLVDLITPKSKAAILAENKAELEDELRLHDEDDSPYRTAIQSHINELDITIQTLMIEQKYNRSSKMLKQSEKDLRKALR